MSIKEIADQFIQLNHDETAQPEKKSVEVYRELQALQGEMSESLRDVFLKHRQFVLGRQYHA